MLGWALKRNAASANDASGPDDTQLDQPDTPAPVFAVRALKTALFGTPAPQDHRTEHKAGDITDQNERDPDKAGTHEGRSTKPPGILLTPGTGTTRRKRVSFGHDVKTGAVGQQASSACGLSEESAAQSPSLFVGKDGEVRKTRPKSRLTQALENARKQKNPSAADSEVREAQQGAALGTDAQEDLGDFERDPDVTVDLNDPHSQSGKYWKSCFETYQADAKAEMEKLVKYKQLAKSYAKMKDSEALDLNQKLKEEQEKVKRMEARVSEMTRLAATGAKGNGGIYDKAMADDLAKQTALAAEYRKQVRELEELLGDDADQESEERPRRRGQAASPRTQRALFETHRELRKARSQLKEMRKLREEVARLQSDLRSAEQKAAKLAEDNKRLDCDLSQNISRISDLERKLEETRTETRQKDREIRRLRSEHDQLKENAKTRFVEAEQVIQKKNAKISDLSNEIRTLRTETEPRWSSGARGRETDRSAYREKIKARNREGAGAETKKSQDTLDSSDRQNSISNRLEFGHAASDGKSGKVCSLFDYNDETARAAGMLRERMRAEMERSSSSVLSDRGNLQDTRRTTSSTSNRHSFPSSDTKATSLEPHLPTITRSAEPRSSMGDLGLRREMAKGYSEQRKSLAARPSVEDSDAGHIDLIQGNFARLGGPGANTSTAWSINTSKAALSADRRAAAIARLERKKAERSKSYSNAERNKENAPLV